MSRIKKLSWGLLIVAIIAPIVCNILIGIPRLPNIGVVGKATDWLLFYGSYLGSVIATLASFCILYKTIQNSRHQQELELRHKEILAIRDDLADRFGKYCVSEIIRLDVADNPTNTKFINEATRLQLIRDKYSALSHSVTFWYGEDGTHRNSYEETFLLDYQDLMKRTIKLIDKLIILYSLGTENEDFKSKLMGYAEETKSLSSENDNVHMLAHRFYKNLIEEFQQYQKL